MARAQIRATPRPYGHPRKQVNVELTMDDYRRIRALVAPLGITVGRFVREAALRACTAAEIRSRAAANALEHERQGERTAI